MFEDRTDAGRQLADVLDDHDVTADVVLAVPRGGLPVGRVVADRLGVPLDVVVACEVGAPGNPGLTLGAAAADGAVWIDESTVEGMGVGERYVEERTEAERAAARERRRRYRGDRPPLDLVGRTVVVVDDGVAAGATTIACLRQVRQAGAERVVLAVPVAPPDVVDRLLPEADEVIVVEAPPPLRDGRTVLRGVRDGTGRAGRRLPLGGRPSAGGRPRARRRSRPGSAGRPERDARGPVAPASPPPTPVGGSPAISPSPRRPSADRDEPGSRPPVRRPARPRAG